MNGMDVREAITGYIQRISKEPSFDPKVNLFEYGVLTSLDVLSLVAFLEDTFKLEISGDDIDMETFGTIDGLVSMISAKRARS